jgi:hypothetical protein
MAMRRPAIRLNKADFPTFGRPAMAMFIALLYQRNDEARSNDETPALLFARYLTTPSPHCALRVSA